MEGFRLLLCQGGPVESTLRNKLEEALHPTHIEIMNESYMHNVPPGSETHFKVLVVSEAFNDLSLIKRHRLVNATLSEELKKGVHALSIVARTPAQWAKEPQEIECSPACQGGFGK
ncbi:bolA-like protein 1 isoform X3 [Procambarus clarkii]|uniref:bolA-like protein 1 isoform X3 n=1 Tax=Procambarus clarkii TaxID=6728 RepID=UPI001E672BC3|nr:bolA-like protein 1 isoform X2 [Procambarus clarkii]